MITCTTLVSGSTPAVATSPPGNSTLHLAAAKARNAVKAAQDAAANANQVASQSVHINDQTRAALDEARGALRDARAQAHGLSKEQHQQLKDAEKKLLDATHNAEFGRLRQAEYLKAQGRLRATITKTSKAEESSVKESNIRKLEKALNTSQSTAQSELGYLRQELDVLRQKLAEMRADALAKGGTYVDDASTIEEYDDTTLDHAEKSAEDLENKIKNAEHSGLKMSTDEVKAKIEKLRETVARLEFKPTPPIVREHGELHIAIPKATPPPKDKGAIRYEMPVKKSIAPLPIRELDNVPLHTIPKKYMRTARLIEFKNASAVSAAPSPAQAVGSFDTVEMPTEDLEPFGRENTAQELTEASIRESNAMVDQIERAEIAEEKRAVHRALTRLRGAAIANFDGVARAQTRNIDGYAKNNRWSAEHKLKHLADEERDVSKWAFPENADLLEKRSNLSKAADLNATSLQNTSNLTGSAKVLPLHRNTTNASKHK